MIMARTPSPGEVDRACEICSIAFDSPLEEWQHGFHRHVERYGLESMIVVEHEGRLVSAMVLTLQPLWMGDTVVPGAAVGGVATIPEARRLGCAAAMMHETIRRLEAWGIVGSPMWPFSFAYYRKFGWEVGGESRVITWQKDIAWQVEPFGEVSAITPEDWPDVASVWDGASRKNRCATARNELDWTRTLKAEDFGGGAADKGGVICRQDGKPAAYALYRISPDTEEDRAKPADLPEVRALNPAAEIAVLRAVAERVPNEKLSAIFSPRSALRSAAVDARALCTEIHANFGFRIIDPAPILATLRTETPRKPLVLGVRDPIQGDRAWRVALSDGEATVEASASDPDVTCSVQTFSTIASGLLKPRDAALAGLLCGDAKAIETLEAATRTWEAPFRSWFEAG